MYNSNEIHNSNVKVAVRIRPLNQREKNTSIITEARSNSIILKNPNKAEKKTFTYNYTYDSDSTQKQIFDDIGAEVVKNAFLGFNCCIFAYGQSGTGKTTTMMGTTENITENSPEAGLIPRICQALFLSESLDKTDIRADVRADVRVDVSYLEIYKEKIRDLISGAENLTVREHPKKGVFVEGLKHVAVKNFPVINKIILDGNKLKNVAETKLNLRSSRSHSILTIQIKQKNQDGIELISKINLVDLAGSEKIETSGVSGVNLEEAININMSLSNLGAVIQRLAEPNNLLKPSYRTSKLTFILCESLGGNAKTYMIATISPSAINYAETLNTLRYATQTKKIVNKARINHDDNEICAARLREEVEALKAKLAATANSPRLISPRQNEEINKLRNSLLKKELELREIEDEMKKSSREWEEKIQESHKIMESMRDQMKMELEKKDMENLQTIENMTKSHNESQQRIKELESELLNARGDKIEVKQIETDIQNKFEKKMAEFQKERIVEASWELQKKYDQRIEEIKASHAGEVEKLKSQIEELECEKKDYKDLIIQIERLKEEINCRKKENDLLNKQIDQLKLKIARDKIARNG